MSRIFTIFLFMKYFKIKLCIQVSDGARADPADVRRQEHDGGLRPQARQVSDRGRGLQGQDVHEGGGRADAQCAEQELLLLRGVDPQQRDDQRVRHSPQRSQDGLHLRG